MKHFKIIYLSIIALLALSCSDDDSYSNNNPQPVPQEFSVVAQGTAVAQVKTITDPQTGEPAEAFCFLMDLFDAQTGELIGTLEDCDTGTIELEDGSLVSEITTTFNINGKGSFVSQGNVLQVPVGDGIFTTSFTPTENNIVNGTFDFEGVEGKTTLNGEVDLTLFDSNIITFNCLFDVELVN